MRVELQTDIDSPAVTPAARARRGATTRGRPPRPHEDPGIEIDFLAIGVSPVRHTQLGDCSQAGAYYADTQRADGGS